MLSENSKIPPIGYIVILVLGLAISVAWVAIKYLREFILNFSNNLNPNHKFYWFIIGIFVFACAASIYFTVKFPPSPLKDKFDEKYKLNGLSTDFTPLVSLLLLVIMVAALILSFYKNKAIVYALISMAIVFRWTWRGIIDGLTNKAESGSYYKFYSRMEKENVLQNDPNKS